MRIGLSNVDRPPQFPYKLAFDKHYILKSCTLGFKSLTCLEHVVAVEVAVLVKLGVQLALHPEIVELNWMIHFLLPLWKGKCFADFLKQNGILSYLVSLIHYMMQLGNLSILAICEFHNRDSCSFELLCICILEELFQRASPVVHWTAWAGGSMSCQNLVWSASGFSFPWTYMGH